VASFKRKAAPSNPFCGLSLLEFVHTLSPEFNQPTHLADWCEQFEKIARGELVRALCALPIRHHKTETTLHGIVWLLVRDPSARYLLLTHSFERARALGKRLRALAEVAGVGPIDGMNTIEDWSNAAGGGVVVMSAEQSRLGYNVHGVFFDDPLDEHGAMDFKKRQSVDETIAHYTMRCQRNGVPGPVLGVMSRWHPDDPIGRRLLRSVVDWIYIHHAAVVDEGLPTEHAFAENVWPLAQLRKMREEMREVDPTERLWHAQLMGDPKPIGSSKFRPDPERWTVLPDWSFRLAYGADLAFTQGETSDYFALVVMKVYGKKAYLLDVQRTKLDAHMIESTCKAALNKYGYAPIHTYVSGPEVGTVKMLRERGLPFAPMRARYNKLVRAERTIKRWNDLDILIPQVAPWVPGFMHRVEIFRGHDKGHDDDEIDALVSVCDGAMGGAVAGLVRTVGRAYAGFGAK
jgi:predicted phage terminase large subunit-like protein